MHRFQSWWSWPTTYRRHCFYTVAHSAPAGLNQPGRGFSMIIKVTFYHISRINHSVY
jgi:hypothetical protein